MRWGRVRGADVLLAVAAVLLVVSAGYVVANPPGADVAGDVRRSQPSEPTGVVPSSALDDGPMTAVGGDPGLSEPPAVTKQVSLDFSAGSQLPPRWRTVNLGAGRSEVGVIDGALRHGRKVRTAPGKGVLEIDLDEPARRIGVEVRFAAGEAPSGYAALTISESSIIDAATDRRVLPRSGVRLVVEPGRWVLYVVDPGASDLPESVLLSGEYELAKPGGSQRYDVRREGDTLWVTDPRGETAQVTDARVGGWSGSVVGWELVETRGEQVPAAIRRVWAG